LPLTKCSKACNLSLRSWNLHSQYFKHFEWTRDINNAWNTNFISSKDSGNSNKITNYKIKFFFFYDFGCFINPLFRTSILPFWSCAVYHEIIDSQTFACKMEFKIILFAYFFNIFYLVIYSNNMHIMSS
jgi:hypothetical protein